jgi:hypothetical protein
MIGDVFRERYFAGLRLGEVARRSGLKPAEGCDLREGRTAVLRLVVPPPNWLSNSSSSWSAGSSATWLGDEPGPRRWSTTARKSFDGLRDVRPGIMVVATTSWKDLSSADRCAGTVFQSMSLCMNPRRTRSSTAGDSTPASYKPMTVRSATENVGSGVRARCFPGVLARRAINRSRGQCATRHRVPLTAHASWPRRSPVVALTCVHSMTGAAFGWHPGE